MFFNILIINVAKKGLVKELGALCWTDILGPYNLFIFNDFHMMLQWQIIILNKKKLQKENFSTKTSLERLEENLKESCAPFNEPMSDGNDLYISN